MAKKPQQKPGKSEQTVGTPAAFIRAVEAWRGKLDFDLCALPSNAKAPRYFTPEQDSLKQNWAALRGRLWCNPPYGDVEPWVAKMAAECGVYNHGIVLIPASVDSNYWEKYIHRSAAIYWVKGRLTFDGHPHNFASALALLIYGEPPGYYGQWDWKQAERVAAQGRLLEV